MKSKVPQVSTIILLRELRVPYLTLSSSADSEPEHARIASVFGKKNRSCYIDSGRLRKRKRKQKKEKTSVLIDHGILLVPALRYSTRILLQAPHHCACSDPANILALT